VGDGCCFTWINVNHRLDPVGRFMPFNYKADPAWLDPVVEAHGWHRDITPTRISSKDIHSLTHYFRDPSFHLPFFELTFDADYGEKVRRTAIDEFVENTPEGKFKTLLSHLESDALDVSTAESFKTFVLTLRDFFGLTK
jgi:hypothetical protein